jgi:hypothetical protein
VRTTASLTKTVKEGGTLEEIRLLVSEGVDRVPTKRFNLWNGAFVSLVYYDKEKPGEYIFWKSLENVLSLDPDELSELVMADVAEPSKNRVITKGRASLKILQDVVAHICTWPLKKVPSSASGLSKESHGWQFFRSFFEEFPKEEIFSINEIKTMEEDTVTGTKVEQVTLKPLYSASTDYKTATDNIEFWRAEIVADMWMRKCGIPNVLRGIIIQCGMRPRIIRFRANGAMRDIGEIYDESSNFIKSSRGLMMGDPLTKVVLHIINMATRQLASLQPGDLHGFSRAGNFLATMKA